MPPIGGDGLFTFGLHYILDLAQMVRSLYEYLDMTQMVKLKIFFFFAGEIKIFLNIQYNFPTIATHGHLLALYKNLLRSS